MPLTCFVLVVDDNNAHLDQRIEMFQSKEIVAIKAHSLEQAKARILSAPAIDCLITDVNLSGEISDRSGIDLSLLVKAIRPALPIAGYSGIEENEGLGEEEQVFDVYIPKGLKFPRKRALMDLVEEAALRHAQERIADASSKVQRLQSKYGLEPDDVSVLSSLAMDNAGDEMFRSAGYSLKLVTNGDKPYWSFKEWKLRRPFVMWIHDGEENCTASVYQHSDLQAVGSTEEEAIHNLFGVMRQVATGKITGLRMQEADQAFVLAHYVEEAGPSSR